MQLPECGQLFDGRYDLEVVLGRGGAGTVYRAVDRDATRTVAIKVVRPGRTGYLAETESRFTREVRIIANLRGPHTVTMYEFGRSDGGLLYMVFEYVPGRDLSEIMAAAGSLDSATTIRVLIQVLDALQEAHGLGLLHRDLKPENIRVSEEVDSGIHVKLLDFGIARPVDRTAPSITRTGELVGTPRYMSPEQLTDRELTPASDIYSLGVVAFEMLVGRDALQGNRWNDQLDRLVSGHVFTVPNLGRLDARLVAIVGKMSARDPADRYPSAAAVLAVLRELDSNEVRPLPLPPKHPARPLRPLTTRQRITTTIGAIPRPVVYLAVLVLAAVLVSIGRSGARILEARVEPTVEVRPKSAASLIRTEIVPAVDVGAVDDGVLIPDATPDAAVDGCGRPAPWVGTGELETTNGLTRRAWVAHIPAAYDSQRRYPVVVLFHQDAQPPRGILSETKLGALADSEQFIIVAPRGGRTVAWQNIEQVRRAIGDLEATAEQLCIDRSRIFAVGHGPGGRAALQMRCLYPDLAAVATTSYRLEKDVPLCTGFDAIPYINIAPLEDGSAPVDGGTGCSIIPKRSLDEHESVFRAVNACSDRRPTVRTHKTSKCFAWSCEKEFVSCRVDGGRGWPGAPKRLLGMAGNLLGGGSSCDGKPADFPNGQEIWAFFTTATR